MRVLTETFDFWPLSSVSGAITEDVAHKRTGAACAKCGASAKNVMAHSITTALGTTYYARFAIRLSAYPSATRSLWRAVDSTGTVLEISTTSEGHVRMWNSVVGAHPTESEFWVEPEEWFVIEVEWMIPKEGKGTVAWRANGKTMAASQSMSMRNTGIIILYTGNVESTSVTIYIDDVAVNSGSGNWVGLEADVIPEKACIWGAGADGDVYKVGQGDAPYLHETWDTFESHAGRKVGLLHYSDPWLTWDGYGSGATAYVNSREAHPLKSIGGSSTVLEDVISGKEDAKIEKWAKEAASFGHQIFIRPWWEMNGTWFTWGRSSKYIEAWRHFYNIIKPIAPNVQFVWCVNTIYSEESDPVTWYPGDEYVDWTGIDGYSGTNPLHSVGWRTATNLFFPTYARLLEIAPTKPIMICEVGCSEFGGSKAAWIADFFGNALPHTMPEIKCVSWFNWNIEEGEGRLDWQIESSESSQSAFKTGVGSSYYSSGFPVIALTGSSGSSTSSLALTAPTAIPLEPAIGFSSTSGDLTSPPLLTFETAGVGSMTLNLSPPTLVGLTASSGVSTLSLGLTAPTQIPLNKSEGKGSGVLLVGTLSTGITTGPNDPTSGRKAVFNLIAYEPNCTFLVSLDGGPWKAPTGKAENFEGSKTIATHEIPGVEQGKHTLRVKAVNSSKEEDESPAEWSWERKLFLTKANSMYFDVVENYRFTRSDVLIDFPDSQIIFDYTPTGSFAGSHTGVILKMIDANNYIWAYIGKENKVKMGKVEEGVSTDYAPTETAFARVLGSKYRIRFQFEDGVITVYHGEYPEAVKVAEYVMSAPDKAKFGDGIIGKAYVDLTPGTNEWVYDNLSYSSSSLDAREVAVVINNGNAEAQPTIVLTGPMTAPTLVNLDADDDNKSSIIFKPTAVIEAGEEWTIDVEKGTLEDEEGKNKFDQLDPTSGWLALVPGTNHIALTASETGSEVSGSDELASAVSFAYRHAWF